MRGGGVNEFSMREASRATHRKRREPKDDWQGTVHPIRHELDAVSETREPWAKRLQTRVAVEREKEIGEKGKQRRACNMRLESVAVKR